jgi:hypothetical protein
MTTTLTTRISTTMVTLASHRGTIQPLVTMPGDRGHAVGGAVVGGHCEGVLAAVNVHHKPSIYLA